MTIIGILALATFIARLSCTAASFAAWVIIGGSVRLEHATLISLHAFINAEDVHHEILAHRGCLRKD